MAYTQPTPVKLQARPDKQGSRPMLRLAAQRESTTQGGGEQGDLGPTLPQLMDALDSDVFRLEIAPGQLDLPLGPAQFHDTQDPDADYNRGVVLGIGIDAERADAPLVLQALAGRGALAVILKVTRPLAPALRAIAEELPIGLIAAQPDLPWEALYAHVRTAMAAAGGARALSAHPRTDNGNLFQLADAIAALVGGPTTIEDPSGELLAYSSSSGPLDHARQATILGHRVPEEWTKKLQEQGVFKRLLSSHDVVTVRDIAPEVRTRLAVAVRAGGEVLGSIWVAEGDEPFADSAPTALREAAGVAALHLVRQRHNGDPERNRKRDALRDVLEGRVPTACLSQAIEVGPKTALTVFAFQIQGINGHELSMTAQRLLEFITLYCTAYRRNAAGAVLGDTVYLLLAEAEVPPRRLEAFAQELLDRAGEIRARLRVGISATVRNPDDIIQLRREAEQVLRVLETSASLGQVGTISELRSRAFLLDLREHAARFPELREGKLTPLVDEDKRRGSTHVKTLRAYLEHFGDVPSAAASLPVHTNTFRYRLRRLTEIAGLDLDDPDERLVLQLQLRLLA